MNVAVEPFDAEAFNREIGLSPETAIVPVNQLSIPESDKDALRNAAEQPATGIVPAPAPSPASEVPDYLKEFTPERPADNPVDWAAELEELTGKPVADGQQVSSDDFFREAHERSGYFGYLNQITDYREMYDRVNRDYSGDKGAETKLTDDKAIITKAVRQSIGEPFIEAEQDRKLAYFFTAEGQLTPEGDNYANLLRNKEKSQVEQWETEAKAAGKTQADNAITGRASLSTFIKNDFRPTGIALSDDDLQLIEHNLLSGQTQKRLEGALTNEDAAWIEIALNPYLRGVLAKKHFERGGQEGAKQKLASQLR